METRVVIRRGWVTDIVTASCPELEGCSATAPDEKQALEGLRLSLREHFARRALAEQAMRAAEELAQRVAHERAAAASWVPRRPVRHAPVPASVEPAATAWEPDTDRVADGAPDTGPLRLPPAPSPMRPRPSIDHCISTLVQDVLRRDAVN